MKSMPTSSLREERLRTRWNLLFISVYKELDCYRTLKGRLTEEKLLKNGANQTNKFSYFTNVISRQILWNDTAEVGLNEKMIEEYLTKNLIDCVPKGFFLLQKASYLL